MSLPVRVTVTAKVEAVTPEGDEGPLVEFLRAYRDSVQLVVDGIWGLDRVPSERTLHRTFYSGLRGLGFRAHHVSEIYRRAREVVESTKRNGGSKPVLRRLTARIHPLDYKLDLSTKTIKVAVLHDRWVELKLKWYSYLDRYLEGSWRLGEVLVSYRYGRFYVYITFHRDVVPREPQAVMGVDINFNNLTYTILDLNRNLVSMGIIPFRGLKRALHLRKLAEGLQRRYPRSWRFLRWARRVRARWLRRARNILVDAAHRVSKRLVEVAREYNAVVVFEDLEKIRESGNGGGKLSWERPMWCYRRIQEYAEYKALVGGIKVIYVDPAGTSRRSPNGKKLGYVNYRLVQLGGAITTRDVVASWNLALRGLKRMRGSRVRWSPDSPAGEGMRTRPNAGNPEVENYSQLTVGIYR
ncbi:MAG: IS200/IS605 family accessory protein TnpB-related protein [Desulfurococcaceae archaeon]|nr:IS200/IS605 family accessory protein TnpB-related protein [Desulfurococcaceae archaeon]